MPQTNQPAVVQGATITGRGIGSFLNVTAATLVKASRGRIANISVITAGSTVGSANDVASIAGALAANEVFAIPNIVGMYNVDFPCQNGIVVTPGTGQVIAISYN